MAKKKGNGIFQEASRLRQRNPRLYADWQDAVAAATAMYNKKHHGKSPASRKKKKGKKRAVGSAPKKKAAKRKKAAPRKKRSAAVGATYSKSQIKKQLEARKGWLYVNRDNAKKKTDKKKYQEEINNINIMLKRLK